MIILLRTIQYGSALAIGAWTGFRGWHWWVAVAIIIPISVACSLGVLWIKKRKKTL